MGFDWPGRAFGFGGLIPRSGGCFDSDFSVRLDKLIDVLLATATESRKITFRKTRREAFVHQLDWGTRKIRRPYKVNALYVFGIVTSLLELGEKQVFYVSCNHPVQLIRTPGG